jgi:hypothetical protein
MRNKLILFCSIWAVLIAFTTSCKKTTQDYIQTLLTDGQWQLASVQVFHFTGATQDSIDTLNTTCNLIQTFKFNTDKTCTYTNFDCTTQSSPGHWALTQNELFLNTDIKTADTTASDNSVPFQRRPGNVLFPNPKTQNYPVRIYSRKNTINVLLQNFKILSLGRCKSHLNVLTLPCV